MDYGPDLHLIDFTFPDVYVDHVWMQLVQVRISVNANPSVAKHSNGTALPTGLGVNALDVVMNVCDDNFVPCDRSTNLTAHQMEVLLRGLVGLFLSTLILTMT